MANSRIYVTETGPCRSCGIPVECSNKHNKTAYYKSLYSLRKGIIYCSIACRDDGLKAAYARRSEAMLGNNPMKQDNVRAKVATSLRARGWGPSVRGGNGQPMPMRQIAFASMLGWKTEVAIPTKLRHLKIGYPTCYKLDIACPALKIGIEIDGKSHNLISRQQQDIKKDDFLRSLGWIVLRFKNERVDADLQGCVDQVLALVKGKS